MNNILFVQLLAVGVFCEYLSLIISATSPEVTVNTECPKIYCTSVLHLLKYTENLYLSRCSTDSR